MDIEQRLDRAQQLAQTLSDTDENEVKKVLGFLIQDRDLSQLHILVQQLVSSPFAKRSGRTRGYYERIQKAVTRYLPTTTDVEDAIWILGWATRLMKYEQAKRQAAQPRRAEPSRGHRPPKHKRKGGRR